MTRTRKVVAGLLLVTAVAVGGLTTAALATDNTATYAYLPDHSVYFYDVADGYSWAHREVDALALAGVIRGGGDYLFYPDNAITRADFILMLDRAFKMSEAVSSGQVPAAGNFSDVPAGEYYTNAVGAAKALGIAAGGENNQFYPLLQMSRQDAMVFLKRTLDRTDKKLRAGLLGAFADADQVTDYAQDAVGALVGAQVISGSDGKLLPQAAVTRAEMAVMLYRATHLTQQDSGVFYEKRSDMVNVCIGAQVYRDVIIENYDPSQYYGELMRYTKLRQEGGITYITFGENQQIDRVAVYKDHQLTLNDPTSDKEGATIAYSVASDCVAIDVTAPYHQIGGPTSTGSGYRYCYPSVTDGEAKVIYYTE